MEPEERRQRDSSATRRHASEGRERARVDPKSGTIASISWPDSCLGFVGAGLGSSGRRSEQLHLAPPVPRGLDLEVSSAPGPQQQQAAWMGIDSDACVGAPAITSQDRTISPGTDCISVASARMTVVTSFMAPFVATR